MNLGRMGTVSSLKFLAHVLRKSDWAEVRAFLDQTASTAGRSRLSLAADCLASVLRHGVTPAEYFRFRFPDHPDRAWRGEWVGAFLYRLAFISRVNAPKTEPTFRDKSLFRARFEGLVHPHALVLRSQGQADELQAWLAAQPTTGLIVKPTLGCSGHGITAHSFARGADGLVMIDGGLSPRAFLSSLSLPRIVERRMVNHPAVDPLSPTALSSVRLHTFVRGDGEVEVVSARLRMALAGPVDNLHAGGIAAPVDVTSGVVSGPAAGADVHNLGPYEVHPVTGATIPGVALPFWAEVLDLARRAALTEPSARYIGFDIGVTPEGPILIEGNYSPGISLWQCPDGRGHRAGLNRLLSLI